MPDQEAEKRPKCLRCHDTYWLTDHWPNWWYPAGIVWPQSWMCTPRKRDNRKGQPHASKQHRRSKRPPRKVKKGRVFDIAERKMLLLHHWVVVVLFGGAQNSIAFGSAPRREVDSQPISQLDRPAVRQTETHTLGFLLVADTLWSSREHCSCQNR